MEAGADRKFVLRMTCVKNGGFRKYQSLPPQEVFKHAYWVLAAELEVKIKQKQTFFTRKTEWMRLPLYLAVNKGLLFVYTTKDSGYALRVSSANKLNFEAVKQKQKKAAAKNPEKEYSAQISLQFQFGEIEIKFDDAEVLRSWRAILLVAHESPKELALLGQEVTKNFLQKSPSLESVVSAKSIFPEDGDKDKSERMEVHRHPMIVEIPDQEVSQPEVKASASSSSVSSVASSVIQYPAQPPAYFVGDYEIPAAAAEKEEEVSPEQQPIVKEAGSNSSLWSDEGSEEEESKAQTADFNNNNGCDESLAAGTSEVNVTLRDVKHSPAWKKSEDTAGTAGIVSFEDVEECEDGTANSHTTACKTSPSQVSRQNSIASIASRRSMFLEDFRKLQDENSALPGLQGFAQMNITDVTDAEEVETAVPPSPSTPEAQKVAAIQSDEFVAGTFKDDPLRKSVFIKVPTPAAPVQQIQKFKITQAFERQPLQQQVLRPFSAPPPTRAAVPARASTLPIPEHTPSKEIVKRLERMAANAEPSPKRVSFGSVPKVPARLSNLEYWRVKELQSESKPAAKATPLHPSARQTDMAPPSVRQLSRKRQDESHI